MVVPAMDDVPSLDQEFVRIRHELGIPDAFPDAVLAAADDVASRPPRDEAPTEVRSDYGIVPFITIDPAGAMDLDQAFYAQARDGGYIVLYAIADVGHFVDRGSPIEIEAWRRGVTLYSPDVQTPLYPPALSRGTASLLPDVERPCVMFSFELDADGRARMLNVERATIRSRAKLDYESVSRHLVAERDEPGRGEYAGREWAESLAMLEAIGRLRQQLEAARGGVSLPIAAQHVRPWSAALSGYQLTFKDPDDVEGWNAQISLMTGIEAARLMVRAEIGLLRTLDPPREEKLAALRLTAEALGVEWPAGTSYAEFIHSLDPTLPLHAAVIYHAAGVMGGARYLAFEGAAPTGSRHAAIAAYYAHVTAPLRRLADRYVLDLLVELAAGGRPVGPVMSVLHQLPAVMLSADRTSRMLETAIVDHVEARTLAERVGERFDALVIRIRADRVTVQIADPPVRADLLLEDLFAPDAHPQITNDGSAIENGSARVSLGQAIAVELASVDDATGRVRFKPV